MLFLLALALRAPLALVPVLLWLSWRLSRGRLGRRRALIVPLAIVLLVGISEAIPAYLAASIARESAQDQAGSVRAESILFPSAVAAADALAARPALRFTEGWLSDRDAPGYDRLPLGPLRFSGVRPLAAGASCDANDVEERLVHAGAPVPRRCVDWQPAPRYEAAYETFGPETVRRRVGPYAVREFATGIRRRADGRAFNVSRDVEVSGGLLWHMLDLWMRATGLIGFGHPGYVDDTFAHLPREDHAGFLFQGALPPPGAVSPPRAP